MLNGFSFLSEFAANIISIIISLQNMLLITTGINDLILDSYHKPLVSVHQPLAKHWMLFYQYLLFQGHRCVFHVWFCSSTLLFFFVSLYFYIIVKII
jgi:hypothetical protein